MLVATGWHSAITQALLPMLDGEEARRAEAHAGDLPLDAERYLFAAGIIRAKRRAEQSPAEIAETLAVNACDVIRACQRIFAVNEQARICVIGSESAYAGSFDETYAEAKRLLHAYVETARLRHPGQQLVAIAPGIIADAGMTLRRIDKERVEARAAAHRKRRHVSAEEVARLVRFVLYEDRGFLSGTVIRMHGGEGADGATAAADCRAGGSPPSHCRACP